MSDVLRVWSDADVARDLLARLEEQRGSKPRCHFLTHGRAEDVAERLTNLIAGFGSVSADDAWMPVGFDDLEEAQLDKAPRLLNADIRGQLKRWWLAARREARTPCLDIASTCTIGGKRGLVIVEAKAHDGELEVGGKRKPQPTPDSKANHEKIAVAIGEAGAGLERATSLPFRLSRDSHYQMSNRFAWGWKLTELGIPVAVVYLGFVRAHDMCKPNERPFADGEAWERLVKAESKALFPPEVWGRRWESAGNAFVPLIKSLELPLPGAIPTSPS